MPITTINGGNKCCQQSDLVTHQLHGTKTPDDTDHYYT
jgi:hypothetical protein